MKRKTKESNGRKFISMRSKLLTILLSGIVLLGVSSCATVPKEPLASGEVRLLSMNVLGAGLEANSSFAINIFFEASGPHRSQEPVSMRRGGGGDTVRMYRIYHISPWERRELSKYVFPVLTLVHIG